MTPRQVAELQARAKLLESMVSAAREENRRLKAGDEGSIVAQLQESLRDIEKERDEARSKRDAAEHRMRYAELRASELAGELETLKRRRSRKKPAEPELSVSAEMWRRFLQLCHPDRHGNSPAATEATRWLLENRP